MLVDTAAGGRPPLGLRRARLATATLFFANGCGLGSWLPRIPDVKIWHDLSDGVLGPALLAIAGGAVAALPVAGTLTARYGSRPMSRAAALLFCAVLPLPLLAPDFALLLAAFILLGIGIGALDVSMNAHAVLVEERYRRPIMSQLHGMFSLGGLFGAALAGGAMTVGLPPVPHLITSAAVLGIAVLAAWPMLLPTAPARPPAALCSSSRAAGLRSSARSRSWRSWPRAPWATGRRSTSAWTSAPRPPLGASPRSRSPGRSGG